jgi:hypothetical protein
VPTTQPDASTSELLKAVEQLSLPDLERFVSDVLELRARRVAPFVSGSEAELLARVAEAALPEDRHRRYHDLREKLHDETLTPAEHAELLKLSDEIEARNVGRVKALLQLAQLRGTTLAGVMRQLGIGPCTDE